MNMPQREDINSRCTPKWSCSGLLLRRNFAIFRAKVTYFWHKHARILDPSIWTGRLTCNDNADDELGTETHRYFKIQISYVGTVSDPIESPFAEIITCFTSIPPQKTILSLRPNSMDRNYFPWDLSALSLSIFVLSLRHCFAAMHMHLYACSVPFEGDFLCKNNYQSSASILEQDNTSVINQNNSLYKSILATGHSAVWDSEFDERSTNSSGDPCKQIHSCRCYADDQRIILVKDKCVPAVENSLKKQPDSFPFLHIYCPFRAIFLIHLLCMSFIPAVSSATTNMTGDFRATPYPNYTYYKTGSPVKLFCDQFSLENLLDKDEMQQCLSNPCDRKRHNGCCKAMKSIEERDKQAEKDFQEFMDTMSKYATSKMYSVQWPLSCCKTAYKNWVCSFYHRYYEDLEDGERVRKRACESICTRVEASCPFFRVHHNTKLYGGQPTFFCKGFYEADTESSMDCHDMTESICEAQFRHG